jgi:hypothetical protein
LPKDAPAGALAQIQRAVGSMDAVEESGELTTRGLEIALIGVWVKLISDSVGLTDKLIDVVRKLFGVMRDKGIKGAKVTIGTTVIELGDMSLDEFERTMARLRAAA